MLKRIFIIVSIVFLAAARSYSQDGRALVYLGSDNGIKMINPTTLEEIGEIPTTTRPDSIELRPDKKVAFAYSDNFIPGLSVVDLTARRTITTLFPDDKVFQVKIGPNGLA